MSRGQSSLGQTPVLLHLPTTPLNLAYARVAALHLLAGAYSHDASSRVESNALSSREDVSESSGMQHAWTQKATS